MGLMMNTGALVMSGKNRIDETHIRRRRRRNGRAGAFKPRQIKSPTTENDRAQCELQSQDKREKAFKP